ncbi:MAG: DUF3499 family protein [Mycobacteriaceae bacterium]|uniref:DUF3499 family protein n=1 Tax=Corynebacterium sp. TaxID=1720 RepID=UPI003F997C66
MVAVTDYRQCSRPGCGNHAIATLRYNYAARTATITHLEPGDDPHSWDLCERHLARQTVPEGWGLDREEGLVASPPVPVGGFDVSALSDASDADFTDEEMQALAAALEGVPEDSSTGDPDSAEPTSAHAQPVSRVVRRTDIPQPTGHHPSRRNLPGRAPQRHLRAVEERSRTT